MVLVKVRSRNAKSTKTRIETHILEVLIHSPFVAMRNPLKQGLKHKQLERERTALKGRNAKSTKTRIETRIHRGQQPTSKMSQCEIH